jgi:hypothetical protein
MLGFGSAENMSGSLGRFWSLRLFRTKTFETTPLHLFDFTVLCLVRLLLGFGVESAANRISNRKD